MSSISNNSCAVDASNFVTNNDNNLRGNSALGPQEIVLSPYDPFANQPKQQLQNEPPKPAPNAPADKFLPPVSQNIVSYSRPALKPDNAFKNFCDRTDRARPSNSGNYDQISHDLASFEKWPEVQCHWSKVYNSRLPVVPEFDMCTHDPKEDTVISKHIHEGKFWGSYTDFLPIFALGPCTEERPYALDIGANLGFFSHLLMARGCRTVAFEPLFANAKRMIETAKRNNYLDRLLVYKHAVGSYHDTVSIYFRSNNPGASSINSQGDESMEMITIDSLLLGPNPPVFLPNAEEKSRGITNLLPVIGKHIGYVKIDTEGYDVPVAMGAIQTFVDGEVPFITIEFQPKRTNELACSPYDFIDLMYDNDYYMVEEGKLYDRDQLRSEFPNIIQGQRHMAYEAFFIKKQYASDFHSKGFITSGFAPSN